jgi:hypothetical protein
MKKSIALLILIVAVTAKCATAQAIYIAGMVKDDAGNPISYAFIRNMGTVSATFSDSLGNYKLMISPNNSRVEFLAKGYAGIIVNAADANNVVLKRVGKTGVAGNTNTAQQGVSQENRSANQNFQLGMTSGAMFVKPRGDTHGSQYLLDNWAHGFIVDSKDSVLQNPNYLYNYDKIAGVMVFTQDKSSVLQLDKAMVKSFVLFSNDGKSYAFEKAPNIDPSNYVQVLATGKKYKIYKLRTTQFVKADYQTNGMSSSGNNYDEYVDEDKYYVYDVQGNVLQKITLKKKSLKEGFAKDADRLNKFMSDHSSNNIDDTFLVNLGEYMNE